jgi:hypothetical protein
VYVVAVDVGASHGPPLSFQDERWPLSVLLFVCEARQHQCVMYGDTQVSSQAGDILFWSFASHTHLTVLHQCLAVL